MPFGTTAALITAGALSAGSSIAGGAMGSSAATHAADTQAQAEEYAAQLQQYEASQALDFQKSVYNQQQAQISPWIQAGQEALQQYQGLAPFQSPTAVTEQNDPGYQFRLQQGENALQSSAAARGTVLSGGTGKALERYGQDYASNEYGNVYNRALQQYGVNANKLSQLAGLGQTAVGQSGQAGQSAAGNVTSIDLGLGSQVGQDYANAAAARGSGYVGSANAWGGALGNLSNLGALGIYGSMMQPHY